MSDHASASAAGHDPAEIDRHVKVYITVFIALLILTVVTVAIASLHLAVPMAIAAAVAVATIKGSLVACYFMHLISEKKFILLVLAITIAFFIPLMVLPILTHSNGFWIH